MKIEQVRTQDRRFRLPAGAGSDAVHRDPQYAYAVTELVASDGSVGTGFAFTLGGGNQLVCETAEWIARDLRGCDVEVLMAEFGDWQMRAANAQDLRWLGPHKGVVQLALASVTNACWDLWSQVRGKPLWRLLLDLPTDVLLRTLDFSYTEDLLSRGDAAAMIEKARETRPARTGVLSTGYPGYDTSVGWFNYGDEELADNVRRSREAGFTAFKLKVGSPEIDRDVRRARIMRQAAGAEARVMVDANQQWTVAEAVEFAAKARELDLYWIEEPTHPDDCLGHAHIARAIAPVKVATGEHLPNRVVFKNYLQAGAMAFCQVDAVRVAGVSEFLVVSMLARASAVPVVPHVGDMGQLHQHLVLFNHIGLGHEVVFLEHIPHLRGHFAEPVELTAGRYRCPDAPGASCRLLPAD